MIQRTLEIAMSRGESYGGGQSSLGYLFGSDNQKLNAPPASPVVYKPPWGDDNSTEKAPIISSPSPKSHTSNNHQAHGQNAGTIITDRPTTKVQSVPGGDSSLGYLFGEK